MTGGAIKAGAGMSLEKHGPPQLASTVRAQDKVNPDDALAASLQYVEDASASQRAAANHRCAVCLQYNGSEADDWAGCNIFAGNLVKGSGWCSAFVARG